MSDVDKALATQVRNIEERTGRTLEELFALVRDSGLTRHGEIRDRLKQQLGLGHGDANTVAHLYFKSLEAAPASPTDPLDAIYAGPKAALRPIHDALMAAVTSFGPFEIAPKKGYLSLRRKKQFAMIGPATQKRVDVGLNVRDLEASARLRAMPPGGMSQYTVGLTAPEEVDAQVVGWVRRAYDSAG